MARGEYQLWDLTTGNCAGAYDDETTALAEIRAGIREDGPDSFESIALIRSTGRADDVEDLGQGRALVARVLAAPDLLEPSPSDRLGISEQVPHLNIRGRGDVRITADG